MTYWLLNLGFLAVAAAVALAAGAVQRRRTGEAAAAGRRWRAAGLAFAVLCVLTALFDNLMIAAGLFGYSQGHISGWRIGLAPLEDFSYILAAAILLPALWTLLPVKDGRDDD
ncbi:lycopene cyclase domain-containing protein [Arthrobacter sp. I2-34]|uniref:Lycopene cyclase domain-containing protein n=1 Tax=Arthrobacter hankyongi TaxID=2904801 RepID=A0ABS9LDZ9_9MICC|nr:lycopene cyclase domain-containing protein [Arthrobacter hankyongi]MCG2624853.1 lycopene cyclase domain-containing protein [Arthrobacter hankyongi]